MDDPKLFEVKKVGEPIAPFVPTVKPKVKKPRTPMFPYHTEDSKKSRRWT